MTLSPFCNNYLRKTSHKVLASFGITLTVILNITSLSYAGGGREIGHVDTEWKLLGANHKVIALAYSDPDIPEVICYVSQAKKGGVSGSVGLAEDPSSFGLSCTRTASNVKWNADKLKKRKKVFSASTSILFKDTEVYRFFDKETSTLVYMAVSKKIIDGSSANAISVVNLK